MTARKRIRRCGGFTLVEVLVSLLVLSVGLLGVGKLMFGAIRSDDSAFMRTQATALAYEMLDAMRANRSTALSQGYDTTPAQFAALSDPGVLCDSGPDGVVCSSGQTLAQYDLWSWKQRMGAAGTPGALPPTTVGSVTTATGANNQVVATITVQWDDSLAQRSFNTSGVAPALNQAVTLTSVL